MNPTAASVWNRVASIFLLLLMCSSEALCAGDMPERVLIEIQLSAQRVDSANESSSASQGYGSSMSAGPMSISTTGPDGLMDGSFDFPPIQKFIEKTRAKTKRGRTVSIQYRITNFRPLEAKPEKPLHLFEFGWALSRFDYRFRGKDGEWKTGNVLPNAFFFDEPSRATVHGMGEADILVTGLKVDIAPKLELWQIEGIEVGQDFTVIQSRFPVRKTFLISFVGNAFKDRDLSRERLVLEGRAALDDTLLITMREPWWYPWDRYEMRLSFGTVYPAEVTVRFEGIEDLEVETNDSGRFFAEEKKRTNRDFELKRPDIWRSHWFPILSSIVIPLAFYLLDKVGAKIRILAYAGSLATTWFGLPNPPEVPWYCLGNMVLVVSFVLVVIAVEVRHGTLRAKRRDRRVRAGDKVDSDGAVPELISESRSGETK